MAKIGLTILEISYLQKHFVENMSSRNVDQKPNNWTHFEMFSYFCFIHELFQKYESSSQNSLKELGLWMG